MQSEALEAARLMRVVERMVRAFRVHSAGEPLSLAAGAALNTLASDGPLGVTQLARMQGVSQPAMTQLVDRLAADGLVERLQHGDDRRSVQVALTAAGEQAVGQRRARRTHRFEGDLGILTPVERAAIDAALPALEHLSLVMMDPLSDPRTATGVLPATTDPSAAVDGRVTADAR